MNVTKVRERLIDYQHSLSDGELLFALLGGKNFSLRKAYEVLEATGGFGGLATMSAEELVEQGLLTKGQAQRVYAAISIGRRSIHNTKKRRISSPEVLFEVVRGLSYLDHEELWVVLVNTKLKVKDVVHLYKGTLDGTCVRVAEILEPAIKTKAKGLAIVHNHPSGDTVASPEDIRLAKMVKQACDLMGLYFVDSLIVARDGFMSMLEAGLVDTP